jgi:predicted nucleic acid-binding protein
MVSARLLTDGDLVAPHVIDVEAFGVIRDLRVRGLIDETTALMAVEDLRAWPAERFGHGPLLDRAWELRDNVRGWDAMYVALAEIVGAPLITLDRRLAAAPGPRCSIELLG